MVVMVWDESNGEVKGEIKESPKSSNCLSNSSNYSLYQFDNLLVCLKTTYKKCMSLFKMNMATFEDIFELQ